jgi:beta-phosphoglucomutase
MGSLELILARAPRAFTAEEKRALADAKNRHYQELVATMTPATCCPAPCARWRRCARPACDRPGLGQQERLHGAGPPRHPRALRLRGRCRTIANSKPHPEIFLRAAADLSVAPGDCLGVEDAVAGVASIKDGRHEGAGRGRCRGCCARPTV